MNKQDLHTYIIHHAGRTTLGKARNAHSAAQIVANHTPTHVGDKIKVAKHQSNQQPLVFVAQSNGTLRVIRWDMV